MTVTAQELKSDLDESVFELNTEGYKKMTMDEFQKSLGGMANGLGF